jgi:hypothetical protein
LDAGPSSDGEALPLAGFMVVRLLVDDSLTIQARHSDGRRAVIRVDAPAMFSGDGGDHQVLVEEEPRSVAPVLALLHRTIAAGSIRATGGLQLAFRGGWSLEVEPAEHFVAWTLEIDDTMKAVCLADGQVKVASGVAK